MAGIPSAPKEIGSASGSTVTNQMIVLLNKAVQLKKKPAILGDAVISQLNVLAQTAKDGKVMLQNVEDKEVHASGELETWLEKVNAAILKADDMLDECKYVESYKEPKDKLRSYFSSRISTRGRQTLITGLKSINSKLQDALKDGGKVSKGKPKGAPDGRSAAAQAVKDSSKLESEVVEDGMQTIVKNLLNPNNNSSDLSVVTLVGWGETGKEALAQLVYKNLDVMCYFDERMWVQVPADLDTDKIGKGMLANLSRVGAAASIAKEEFPTLAERLKGKRFLLVLVGAADINSPRFRVLKQFLEELGGFRGSKVLITTGKNPTIESSFLYRMSFDSSQYCWNLFEKIAFTEGGPARTDEVEETGRAIVNMCAQNPLYIKLIGSLMYRLKDETQWSRILNEKLVQMQGEADIPQLCFDYMTSLPLKRCFLYCYFFPKGCPMSREELIELWMALGYLTVQSQNKRGHEMEALGRMYYDVLMRSSFFQVLEDDDFNMQSCKIPDALHGLKLMTDSKDCFRTIVKGGAMDCSYGVEHLTLIDCKLKYSKSLKDRFSNLRSLRLENNTEGLANILASARGLRVLIIVDAKLEELPDSIGKLIHLKYLDISRTGIVRLPDSISELYNLQTLRLYDLKDFPENFEKVLVSMMHLYIQNLEDVYEMYERLPKCDELVYLSSSKAMLKVYVDKEGRIDHTMLHKLSNRCSTISIHCLENASNAAKDISEWLSENSGTEILKLNWSARRENSIDEDVLNELIPNKSLKELTLENFKGTQFPSWMTKVDSISNLVRMELENCSWCEKLPPLGGLSCLRSLNIVGMDNVKCIAADFYGEDGMIFPKLKQFTLRGMLKLEDWKEPTASSSSAFPYLERFVVDQCPKLERIPDILLAKEQKCLREFKVSHCEKLTHLPVGLGKVDCVEVLELFGLPDLTVLSLGGCGSSLKTLIIGCFSEKLEGSDLLKKELENLTSLTNMTFWGYGEDSIPDCFSELSSLQVLKFESCRNLNNLPEIKSVKELHISYCPHLEDSCIRGSRPEWAKVSHIKTIVVNNEKIRQPRTEKMP